MVSHWSFSFGFLMFSVQDGFCCERRCVDFQDEWFHWVGSKEDQVAEYNGDQLVDSVSVHSHPCEGCSFL